MSFVVIAGAREALSSWQDRSFSGASRAQFGDDSTSSDAPVCVQKFFAVGLHLVPLSSEVVLRYSLFAECRAFHCSTG